MGGIQAGKRRSAHEPSPSRGPCPGACARRGSSGTYSPRALVSSRWPITWADQTIQNQDLRPNQMEPEVGQLRSTRTRIRVHRPRRFTARRLAIHQGDPRAWPPRKPQRLSVTRSPTAWNPRPTLSAGPSRAIPCSGKVGSNFWDTALVLLRTRRRAAAERRDRAFVIARDMMTGEIMK